MGGNPETTQSPAGGFRTGRHICLKPGCGKSFSRPSHLERHALNHSDTKWTCPRCDASFKRLDLLERHKARHLQKDRLAGGHGMGILRTKKRRLHGQRSRQLIQPPLHPLAESSIRPGASIIMQSTPISQVDGQMPMDQNVAEDETTKAQDLMPKVPDIVFDPSGHNHELNSMYYDPGFDAVHFQVSSLESEHFDDLNPNGTEPLSVLDSLEWPEGESDLVVESRSDISQESESHSGVIDPADSFLSPESWSVSSPAKIGSEHILQKYNQSAHGALEASDQLEGLEIEESGLSHSKWREIIALISDIRPVHPDGSLVDEASADLGHQQMQHELDRFFANFNTEYPMIHSPTFNPNSVSPVTLLAMIIMGATYGSREAHQLSVCFYDAIVPHILSGLISIPMPDLETLQAFLILECYGLYRAGPYQRENAILIHSLLFNAIRRLSRYHVKARIMLPDSLSCHQDDWIAFIYAEQYKRLILFVFMWDTQNVSCFSFMPSMSTQSIHIDLPCSPELWEASSEIEWRQLAQRDQEQPKFNYIVKCLVEDTNVLRLRSLSKVSLAILLHGLMSMCNDIVHFDNQAIFIGTVSEEESNFPVWQRQMMHALDIWKSRYDAFLIEQHQGTRAASEAERDTTSLSALYHTAHIFANVDVRNLQIAAGAKAVFGHIVTPDDREESTESIRKWVRERPKSAVHAAWHAGQMFREGLLNLKNWEDSQAFHYPWCLFIGTLTCWAFHHFSRDEPRCTVKNNGIELATNTKTLMANTVSRIASTTFVATGQWPADCCTHGLAIEIARYLKNIRWTAAYEANKILEALPH